MGCASSKQFDADVYRPVENSFAVFDINAIKEPWLPAEDDDEKPAEKPVNLPPPILEKIETLEEAPRTWDEVSKALEDLKPTLNKTPPPDHTPAATATPPTDDSPAPMKKVKRKSFSFHTLEELDRKPAATPSTAKPAAGIKKTESFNELSSKFKTGLKKVDVPATAAAERKVEGGRAVVVVEGYKSLKDNPFLLRDKLEREREGKPPLFIKRNPLEDYPEMCPPGGADKVVLYTTSLGGVRRTYEDCNQVRSIMELHGFLFEERDISLHGKFLTELKELLGEAGSVPRMFVKGHYIGGVEEVMSLNETGRLRRILSRVGIEREVGRHVCEGCGGARFVPCMDCGGSCKLVVEGKKERERCPECNENGLVYCPICS